MMVAAEWIATILSILGAVFVARKNIRGFYCWIIANTLFVIVGASKGLWGVALNFFVLLVIAIYSIINWRK